MNFFDLHCDTPYELYKKGGSFYDGDFAVNMCRGAVFERWLQVCAIWLPDECRDAKARYCAMLQKFRSETDIICDSNSLDSKCGFLLSLEGGAIIDSVDDVDALYRDGIRVITLTWNGKNRLAGGSNTNEPLTMLGRAVISRMNELSVALDVSHLSDRAFFDAASLAKRVIATHCCSRSVHHVRRNLTDEQLKLIAEKNGLVGICLYPRFLGEGDVFGNFSRHLEHIVKIVGEDYVAIGSDFDGAVMDKRLDSIDKIPALYAYLMGRGWKEDMLSKLFYKNAYQYFKELLK